MNLRLLLRPICWAWMHRPEVTRTTARCSRCTQSWGPRA